MSPGEVRANFVFYIGAGAVASAGIIALLRALPTIVGAFRSGFQDLRGQHRRHRRRGSGPTSTCRSGSRWSARWRWRSCSPRCRSSRVNLLGAVLIVVFGFFFVVGLLAHHRRDRRQRQSRSRA